MNRETFITLYKNQLFTASQVVDIVQTEVSLAVAKKIQSERDSWTTDEIIEHEKLAADAERGKVLDELQKYTESFNYHLYPEEMLAKIAELRQAGE